MLSFGGIKVVFVFDVECLPQFNGFTAGTMYIAGLALPKAKRQSGRFKAIQLSEQEMTFENTLDWTAHPTFFNRFMLDLSYLLALRAGATCVVKGGCVLSIHQR